MSPPYPELILFTYGASPFGQRTEWYLNLRGIPYARCPVRNRLPREVLEDLGIKYRRIPILAIGKDIYCDTRLIISKLEQLFPEGKLSSENPAERGVESLLEHWVIDDVFWRVAALIPPDYLRNGEKEWLDDRGAFKGGDAFSPDEQEKGRPEALAHARMHFDLLEHGLLGDGRQWLLGGEKPSMAEIHTVWLFDWVSKEFMLSAISGDVVSEQVHPRVFAWVKRFRDLITTKEEKLGKTVADLSREQTVEKIWASGFYEKPGEIDVADPLKLQKGQVVEIWPIDSGFSHRDKGELLSIGIHEVVVESKSKSGSLRIHYPRTNVRVAAVSTPSS